MIATWPASSEPGRLEEEPRNPETIVTAILLRGSDSEAAGMGDDVQKTVLAIIAKEAAIDVDKDNLDSTLKDLKIQSLDAIQIVFEIEDHYHIQIPDRDPDFDTESVKGLVDTVEKLLAEKAATP